MSLIQEKFASLFSNHTVTVKPRPDGGVLLTLCDNEGKQTQRTLSYTQLHTAEELTWAISAIRRDLAGTGHRLLPGVAHQPYLRHHHAAGRAFSGSGAAAR